MKIQTNLVVLSVLIVSGWAADRPEWDNPSIVKVGVEKPHATMMVYPTADMARAAQPSQSPWYQSLNGTWKFQGSLRPADRPLDFYRPAFKDGAWRTIPVPNGSSPASSTSSPIAVPSAPRTRKESFKQPVSMVWVSAPTSAS